MLANEYIQLRLSHSITDTTGFSEDFLPDNQVLGVCPGEDVKRAEIFWQRRLLDLSVGLATYTSVSTSASGLALHDELGQSLPEVVVGVLSELRQIVLKFFIKSYKRLTTLG